MYLTTYWLFVYSCVKCSLLSTACLLDMSPLWFVVMHCPCVNVLFLGAVSMSNIFVWWLSAYYPNCIYRFCQSTETTQYHLVTATLFLKQVFYPIDCWLASCTTCSAYFSSPYHGILLLLSVRIVLWIMNPYGMFILHYCNVQYSSIFGLACLLVLGFSLMIYECPLWCDIM